MESEDNPESSYTNVTGIHEHAPLTPLASPSRNSSTSPKPSVSSPWDITYDNPTSPFRWFASLAKRCGRVFSLAVSDTGLVYLGSDSKYIRVWKLPGFGDYGRLRSGSSVVKALLVSSDDGLLFSAHSDNKIRVWETRPAHRRKGTLPSLKDRFTETCLHRPRSFLTGGSSSSGQARHDRLGHSGEITSLAYNTMGKFLYSASMDRTVKVWSIGTMRCVETIRAHDDHVNAITLGPDGLLFSGSDDMTVKIWRRSLGGDRSHGLVLNLHVQSSPVKALALGQESETDQDTYLLYAGCSDGYVHYWRKGELSGHMSYCGNLRGHSHAVLCLSSVEKLVVSGSADTSIRVWSRSSEGMAAHTCIATLSGHIGPVKGVVASVSDEEGCLVYSGSLDGSVKLWWVWREGGDEGGGEEGIVGDQRGPSWADYFDISRSFRRMHC